MAHVRQSGPESGLGFQVNVLRTFGVVPSSLGNGVGLDHLKELQGSDHKPSTPKLEPLNPNTGTVERCQNNYFTEMCSGSKAGLCLRLIDFRITHL